jgi:hypothetical protein
MARVKQQVKVRRVGPRRGRFVKFELTIGGKVIGHLVFDNMQQFEAYQMGARIELADGAQIVMAEPAAFSPLV